MIHQIEVLIDRFKAIYYLALETIGYDSIQELFAVSLALRSKYLMFYVYGWIIGSVAVFFTHLITSTESYIYQPAKGVGILAGVTAFDFLLGLSNSISIKKLPMKSNRIGRSFVRFIVQIIFVSIAFNSNSVWPNIVHYWIVDCFLLVFIFTTSWSAIENAKDLELITQEQFEFLQQFVNIKKFFDWIKKDKTPK